MTEDSLPYGDESVNKTIRPFKKVVPFKKDHHRVWLPAQLLKRTDLSAEYKGVLAILASHMDKNYCCWPTHPQLEKMVGFGHCKLEKVLKELRKQGEITWSHFTDEWGHRRNRYTMLCFRKSSVPTPTNQLLATPSKAVVKHSTIYLKEPERVQDLPVLYRAK